MSEEGGGEPKEAEDKTSDLHDVPLDVTETTEDSLPAKSNAIVHTTPHVYPSLVLNQDEDVGKAEGEPMLPQGGNHHEGALYTTENHKPEGASDGVVVVSTQPGSEQEPRVAIQEEEKPHTYCGCSIFTCLCCCPLLGLIALCFSCEY